MKRFKYIFSLTAILVAAVFLMAACAAPAAQETSASSPGASPEASASQGGGSSPSGSEEASQKLFGSFTVNDIDGNEVTQDIFSGHKLNMVNIWGTFCGPCINEMPDLAEISKEYADQGLQIIGIVGDALDRSGAPIQETIDKAKSIRDQTGADYEHLVPTDSLTPVMAQVPGYPTTVFLDSEGNQIGSYVGARDKDKWTEIIDQLLADQPEPAQPVAAIPSPVPSAMVTHTPFEDFETKGLDGETYDEMMIMGDGRMLTYALVWDPSWEGSSEALANMQAFLDNGHAELGGIGFVQADGVQSGQDILQFAQNAGAKFTQLEAFPELAPYFEKEQPTLIAIAPWGFNIVDPFSPAADLQGWEDGSLEIMQSLYNGCCVG